MSAWPPRPNFSLHFPSPYPSSSPSVSHLLLFLFLLLTDTEDLSERAARSPQPWQVAGLYLQADDLSDRDRWRDEARDLEGGKEGERKGGQWLLRGGWIWIAVKTDSPEKKNWGDFNSIAQMFQPPAHKRPNFYQFLWVIPLNWRTIGFDWTHALLPPSHKPFYPLFPSCQSVSPQFTLLMELSDYTDFSCTNPSPPPLAFWHGLHVNQCDRLDDETHDISSNRRQE